MILYQKLIPCILYQTFDEEGVLLNQFMQTETRPTEFTTITIDEDLILEAEDLQPENFPMKLDLEPQLANDGTGQKDKLTEYSIHFEIVIRQLFDTNGKPLGQKFEEYFDEPFSTIRVWNGRKMKSTILELDDNLPFPFVALPFDYDLNLDLVQPTGLSKLERRLVKKCL
jgi:hypothetical protein